MTPGLPDHRLGLADLLIVTAGAALSLAVWLACREVSHPLVYPFNLKFDAPLAWLAPALYAVVGNLLPQLVVASATVVVLSLCRPRPERRRLARRPGFMLCLLAALTAIFCVLFHVLVAWLDPESDSAQWFMECIIVSLGKTVGPTILGSWAALAFVGRGRPGRSWLDRCGVVVAAFWVVGTLVFHVRWLLESVSAM